MSRSNSRDKGPSAQTRAAQSTSGTGTGPRRVAGRLRPLTLAEKRARSERRERLNPERETQKALGAPDNRNNRPVARRRLRPDWFARVARAA